MATLTRKEWDKIRGATVGNRHQVPVHAPAARRRDQDREGRERNEGRKRDEGRMSKSRERRDRDAKRRAVIAKRNEERRERLMKELRKTPLRDIGRSTGRDALDMRLPGSFGSRS